MMAATGAGNESVGTPAEVPYRNVAVGRTSFTGVTTSGAATLPNALTTGLVASLVPEVLLSQPCPNGLDQGKCPAEVGITRNDKLSNKCAHTTTTTAISYDKSPEVSFKSPNKDQYTAQVTPTQETTSSQVPFIAGTAGGSLLLAFSGIALGVWLQRKRQKAVEAEQMEMNTDTNRPGQA